MVSNKKDRSVTVHDQSRGMREATMKHPPAASIESTLIVIARGLGSLSFATARDN